MKDVERIMRYPNTAIASDGGVREFGAGHAASAVLRDQCARARRVRAQAKGADARGCDPPHDVAARAHFRLPRSRTGRAKGIAADLVLFDPAACRTRRHSQQPHQYSEGFDLVLVNGKPVVEDGKADRRAARAAFCRP